MLKKLTSIAAVNLILLGLLLPLAASRLVSAATPVNLIANPSVETSNPNNSAVPQDWAEGGWGTNSRTYSYLSSGHSGSRSLEVQISNYTSGDAKWYFTPVAISPGAQYSFNDYYQSNINSDVVAQFDDGSGNLSYQDLGDQIASGTAWSETSVNFTTPSNAKLVTIFHLINSVGWLQTDDYSLTSYTAPSAPSVTLTSPVPSSTLSGSAQLVASVSDADGIAGVQFKVDGNNIGAEDTTSPYQVTWDTTTVANGSHTLTAVARNINNMTTTSAPVQVTVNNAVAPGTNLITNPSMEVPNPSNNLLPQGWLQDKWGTNTATFSYLSNSGHSGTHSVKVQMSKYTSGDAKWYFTPVLVQPNTLYAYSDYYESNVTTDVVAQFDDGNGNYTYQDLISPASSNSWQQASTSFTTPSNAKYVTIFHLINKIGSLQTDDASLSVSALPTVSITTPSAGSTVSGTVQLDAAANAANGIASVQFKLDGVNLGSPVTTAPYQIDWDTTQTGNGTHYLTATATSSDSQTATSAAITVDISNQTGNMVPNPSMEVADPTNSKMPQDWQPGSWGTNRTTFTYANTGCYAGTHCLKVQISKYTSGDAKWIFTPQAFSSDAEYTFSDYYQSSVVSEVDAVFTMPDGSTIYEVIGYPEAAAQWTQFKSTFSVPSGALDMTVYHLINHVGTLLIDNDSLQRYTPVGFNRPLISLTFDDSIASQYTNALPLLQKYGFKATFYVISGDLGTDPTYMTSGQVKSLYASGEEIGSHTVTHPDLTTLSSSQLINQLSGSQAALQKLLGVGASVNDFAAPYGLFNTTVTTQIKKYYQSDRGVEYGFNDKGSFNPYDIKVQDVDIYTTLAEVNDWIKQAQATNTWLVLVYHAVDPDSQSVGQYDTLPSDLDADLSAVKSSGITVETLSQALAEVEAQL